MLGRPIAASSIGNTLLPNVAYVCRPIIPYMRCLWAFDASLGRIMSRVGVNLASRAHSKLLAHSHCHSQSALRLSRTTIWSRTQMQPANQLTLNENGRELMALVFFVPLPFSLLCMESTSYVLSFRMAFFYLVTTGWIFYVSLCENAMLYV